MQEYLTVYEPCLCVDVARLYMYVMVSFLCIRPLTFSVIRFITEPILHRMHSKVTQTVKTLCS